MVKWQGNHPSSLESDAHIKTWVGGKAAIDVFNKVPTPADRVYVQIPPPPVEDRTYYEMVLGAEVLKGAAVDHTNLRRGRISLLPAHTQQVERVQALALAAEYVK